MTTLVPLRAIYRRVEERGREELPLLSVYRDYGVVPREGREDNFNKASDDLSAYKVVRPGDLVLNKMKTWQGSLAVSTYEGIVSPAYFVGRRIAEVDDRFMHHLLRSAPLIAEYGARSKGIRPSQWDLSWDEFASIKVALPDLCAQRAIADYLDAETARIDALIEKKQRMRALLEVRLDGIIRETFRDLDVPRVPLKRAWRVVDCKHRTPVYQDDGIPVVSPGDATPGRLDLGRCHRFVSEVEFADLAEPPRRPQRGDIIYSRNASIGIAAFVDTDEQFCMGQDVCLITSRDQDQLYLMYVLNTLGLDQLDEAKIGSTFSRVNVAQIVELEVPLPDVALQREVASRLDALTTTTAELTDHIDHQISLIRERRQSLITAAVTDEHEPKGTAA